MDIQFETPQRNLSILPVGRIKICHNVVMKFRTYCNVINYEHLIFIKTHLQNPQETLEKNLIIKKASAEGNILGEPVGSNGNPKTFITLHKLSHAYLLTLKLPSLKTIFPFPVMS